MDWIKGNTTTVSNIKQIINLNNSYTSAVYLILYDETDSKGQCFLSVSTVCKQCGMSKPITIKSIKLLIDFF